MIEFIVGMFIALAIWLSGCELSKIADELRRFNDREEGREP